MKHSTDQSLIEACLAGRREAFGQLVERYQHRLFHSLVHLLGSTEDAQDAAQDALILAFEKLGTFRGESQFYSWLFRIAYNSAVSSKRKPGSSKRKPGSSKRKTGPMSVSLEARRDASGLEPADLNPSTEPSFGLDVSDRQRLVQQALGELSEEFREAIVLKEIEQMSYEEIAEVVGIPLGTVRSRIHRARMELRQKLAAFIEAEVI
ncbi:MAG: sigma-70 family RNA polymerase sigma factor [Planctomycetota bacterium]|nr:MAG: sigma-70 family RNA polymerase sigma factor [Planctomycetota bacterium]